VVDRKKRSTEKKWLIEKSGKPKKAVDRKKIG
jgi:hypothetical protein